MKKRLEDQLIELAFDPNTDSVPAEIAANPAAHQRLSEYRTMKSALGQLRDVPEHQLSTERLREALLHQGLRRRFQFPWQALGYGSTACALFICAFVASRTWRSANTPTHVVGSSGSLGATARMDSPELYDLLLSPHVIGEANTSHETVVSTPKHHHVHQSLVIGPSDKTFAFNDSKRDAFSVGGGNRSPIRPSGSVSDSSLPDVDGDGHPIIHGSKQTLASYRPKESVVVIKQGTDLSTGLDTAQEVTGKNDVLVGG